MTILKAIGSQNKGCVTDDQVRGSVDTENSRKLRELIPQDVVFVSESGVKDAADVAKLREIGADAVLIGETLMRSDNKKAMLSELRGVK